MSDKIKKLIDMNKAINDAISKLEIKIFISEASNSELKNKNTLHQSVKFRK